MFEEQIKQAISEQKKCQICGNKSKVSLSAEHQQIDVSQHQGIVQYQAEELVITVKAGTRLKTIQQALAENNQSLPFEPPDYGDSTIGGTYALALSGSAQAFTGRLRDHVLGVELINGRGEYLRFGGQMMKNVAGYDVSRLLVGSKGALAVIAQISFKVLPIKTQQTYRLMIDEAEAIQLMNQWAGKNLPLSACAYMNGTFYYRLAGLHTKQSAEPLDDEIWQQLNPFKPKVADGLSLWRLSVDSAHPPIPNTIAVDCCGMRRWIVAKDKPKGRFVEAWNFSQMVKEQGNKAYFNKVKTIFDPHFIFI